MSAQKIVNDLSIQVATANGSGSQSANNIIIKTLFRMGIPVGGKNIFPSNIAGLPTWFTIRANKHGYTARKDEVDMMILMNQDTVDEDFAKVKKGGVVIYNSDLKIQESSFRDDIEAYPVPFTTLARDNFADIKLRKLLTNMLYVGFLAELIGLDEPTVKQAISDNFKGKAKAVEANYSAYEIGAKYFKDNFAKKDNYHVEKMDANEGKILIDGNTAAAIGCLFAGCTVVAWYPITPSSSLCESLIGYLKEYRVDENGKNLFAEVQAEDEIAAVGMVLGAGWAGARAMTATSGPGISLMAEFVGLGYYAEIPAVIWDVQRVGPSTGLPTRTNQGDVLSTYLLSHGDTKHVLLLPSSPEECFYIADTAFDLAERLQTPIFVLSDLDIGMNNWMVNEFKYPEIKYDRGKVLNAEQLEKVGSFARYKDVDGDGIPYRTLPGTKHKLASFFTRGSGHNEKAAYSERSDDYVNNVNRLAKKFETAKTLVPKPQVDYVDGAKVGILAFGSSDLAMREARDILEKEGVKTNYLRLKALPFTNEVEEFINNNDVVYIVEQNRDAQMHKIFLMELPQYNKKLVSVLNYNGLALDALAISNGILAKSKVGV
ncbi:MAG: 2-oxoacid:acceptor oxidoreductase subunit alpha [Candidatus Sericytochromatia bacterium]